MSGYIPQEIIDQISRQADIVQVISEYIPLSKSGKNYKALCPFHEETTPSFIVSPEKQVFHCFGCGVGGNIFTFLMKVENVSFPQAVRILGQKVGVVVPFRGEKAQDTEILYKINKKVAEFFQEQLNKNKVAKEYLYRRGFKPSTIEHFKLGWAPSSKEFLNFCKKQNFPENKLQEIGLLIKSSRDNSLYPYFRERIMFPIFSPFGKIIGFGGRVLDDSSPKYLNSPQSAIFDKGKNLYGLNFARRFINKEVIVRDGIDFYVSSKKTMQKVAKKIASSYNCILKHTSTLHTRDKQRSKDVYRDCILIKGHNIKLGDVVVIRGDNYKITTISKNRVTAQNLLSGKKKFFDISEITKT